MRLGAIFGNTWTTRHSSDQAWEITKDEWANGLSGIDKNNIRKALDQIRNTARIFPPNLTEFISICRSFDRKIYEPIKLEEKCSIDVKNYQMKKIKEILNIK